MDGTGTLFEPFVAALGHKFNVKVVSYPASEPLGYSDLESIARAALPTEGPFVVLGESFSGPLAVSIAACCSSRLKGLVLCCTFLRNPRPVFSTLKSFVGVLPVGFVPVRVLSHLLLGRFSTAASRMVLSRALAQVSPSALRARLRAVLAVDVSAKLAQVRVPVLCLRASQDRVVPRAASSPVAQFCPRAKVVPLEAPHFLLQTVPSKAAHVIAAFVRDLEDAL
jgi:pimeloyl-ACP methyl ester carboxylesterase